MSRYAIDTIQSRKPGVIIKVVFFGYNYKSTWMTAPKGGPTVPNRILDRVVVEHLEAEGTLDESIFNEYVNRSKQRLIEKFIEKGKADGASERAQERMADIYDALRAIIVADNLTGALRVQCLNKDKPIATYDPQKQVVDLEGLSWNVAADFASTGNNGPTTPTNNAGQQQTTTSGSGTTTVVSGQTQTNSGQTQTAGSAKTRTTSSGTKRVFGGSSRPHSDESKKLQTGTGGTARTLGQSASNRETGALLPKSPLARWWRKYRFAVLSFVFFFVLSSAIVFGLLKLQKSIESLPDKTDRPQPTLQQTSPADSVQQQSDSLNNVQPNNSHQQQPSATPHLPTKRVTFGA